MFYFCFFYKYFFPYFYSSTCQCNGYTGTNVSSPKNPTNEFYDTGPVCCDGWSGTECDVCSTVDVCPNIDDGNGTILIASECTSGSMAPINVSVPQ